MAAHLRAQVCRILQRDPAQPIDPAQPLLELGLDSLLAVELKNALAEAGVDLPVARVMTGPSLDRLTALVLSVLEQTTPTQTIQPPLPPGAPPIHPIVSHLLVFVLGIVAAIGLYALTLAVAGPSHGLDQAPAGEAGEATEARGPAGG